MRTDQVWMRGCIFPYVKTASYATGSHLRDVDQASGQGVPQIENAEYTTVSISICCTIPPLAAPWGLRRIFEMASDIPTESTG